MIRIIQLLCPQRHCVLAVSYDETEVKPDDAMEQFKAMFQRSVDTHEINPWCGLCASRELSFEDGSTRFQTMEEALPELRRIEEAQMFSRILIEHAKHSIKN